MQIKFLKQSWYLFVLLAVVLLMWAVHEYSLQSQPKSAYVDQVVADDTSLMVWYVKAEDRGCFIFKQEGTSGFLVNCSKE